MHLKVLLLLGFFVVTVTAFPNFVKSKQRLESKQKVQRAKLDDNEPNLKSSRRSKIKDEVEEDNDEEIEKPTTVRRRYSQKKSQSGRKNQQKLLGNEETPIVGKRAYSGHKNRKSTEAQAPTDPTAVLNEVPIEVTTTQELTTSSTVTTQVTIIKVIKEINDYEGSSDHGPSKIPPNSQPVAQATVSSSGVNSGNTSPVASPNIAPVSQTAGPQSSSSVRSVSEQKIVSKEASVKIPISRNEKPVTTTEASTVQDYNG